MEYPSCSGGRTEWGRKEVPRRIDFGFILVVDVTFKLSRPLVRFNGG